MPSKCNLVLYCTLKWFSCTLGHPLSIRKRQFSSYFQSIFTDFSVSVVIHRISFYFTFVFFYYQIRLKNNDPLAPRPSGQRPKRALALDSQMSLKKKLKTKLYNAQEVAWLLFVGFCSEVSQEHGRPLNFTSLAKSNEFIPFTSFHLFIFSTNIRPCGEHQAPRHGSTEVVVNLRSKRHLHRQTA